MCYSSGLGRELTLELLKRGDKVIATGRARSIAKLDALKEKGADTIELDVTAPLDVLHDVAKKAVSIHGRIDVLVNNAGDYLTSMNTNTLAHSFASQGTFSLVRSKKARKSLAHNLPPCTWLRNILSPEETLEQFKWAVLRIDFNFILINGIQHKCLRRFECVKSVPSLHAPAKVWYYCIHGFRGKLEVNTHCALRWNLVLSLALGRSRTPDYMPQRNGHFVVGSGAFFIFISSENWPPIPALGITESLHAEISPLGLRCVCADFGYFRTSFLEADQRKPKVARIDDYKETSDKVEAALQDISSIWPDFYVLNMMDMDSLQWQAAGEPTRRR